MDTRDLVAMRDAMFKEKYAQGRAEALEEAARLFPCVWRPKCDLSRPVNQICSACESAHNIRALASREKGGDRG